MHDEYIGFMNQKGNWSVVEKQLYSPQLNNYRGILLHYHPYPTPYSPAQTMRIDGVGMMMANCNG